MKIAVVILNWNGRKMLERFLPSVVALSAPAEVVVADNGSTDDSLAFLATHYPTLRVIPFDRNYGFAEGYNRALAQIDADYYVLLNDDVEVTPPLGGTRRGDDGARSGHCCGATQTADVRPTRHL